MSDAVFWSIAGLLAGAFLFLAGVAVGYVLGALTADDRIAK